VNNPIGATIEISSKGFALRVIKAKSKYNILIHDCFARWWPQVQRKDTYQFGSQGANFCNPLGQML
jgi:hypothetical protein